MQFSNQYLLGLAFAGAELRLSDGDRGGDRVVDEGVCEQRRVLRADLGTDPPRAELLAGLPGFQQTRRMVTEL